MLELGIGGYTRQQVMDVLHGRSGSRGIVKFRYDLLNYAGVKIGELDISSARISMDSEAEIKRTASFQIAENEAQDIDWLTDRIQPVFCLQMPDGGWIEWPLGVFMMSSPVRRNEGKRTKSDVEAYDESLILREDKFTDRYFIPAGTGYITAITSILNGAGIWKINITPHPGVTNVDKEFEIGTEKLTAVNQLLTEINYTSLWVDENGFFTASPYELPSNREVEYEYKNNEISIIRPGSVERLDLFNVPNVWVRYVQNPDHGIALRSVYRNTSPTSPTSTVRKRRNIVSVEPVNDIYDQATLDAFTKRQAYADSQVYGEFEFATAVMPHHSFYNCLFIEHTDFAISDKFMETAWSMDLTSKEMTHICRKVILI